MATGTTHTIEILRSARLVADLAATEGVEVAERHSRFCYNHLGALLADACLQAGLSYSNVVRPRVQRILVEYPRVNSIEALTAIIVAGQLPSFLGWQHQTKLVRFVLLVNTLKSLGVSTLGDLREQLNDDEFCSTLMTINGIGPKTIDYMACLVGLESIAVDRHIMSYAKKEGVQHSEYYFLRRVFCFAADLLDISRREFDAWVWRKEAASKSSQFSFDFS